MSILTKVLIVVQAVVILVAVPLFIAQATAPVNWRHAYEREQDFRQAAEQTSRQYQIAAKNAAVQLSDIQQALSASRDKLIRTQADLQRQLASERSRNAQLLARLDALSKDTSDLKISLDREITIREKLTNERDGLLEELDKTSARLREMEDTLAQVTGERDRLLKLDRQRQQTIAQLKVELQECQDQIRDLKVAVASGGGSVDGDEGDDGEVTTDVEISGTVTAVRNGLASINIGSAQGIKKGLKMMVYRGPNFVAYLRIDEVQADKAAGTILDKQLDPMQGDKVATME